MSKYDHLIFYFKNLPACENEGILSLNDIERILGANLPQTGWTDRPWWANVKSSSQGASWTSDGWAVEKVFQKALIVTIGQKFINPLLGIPRYLKGLLDGSTHLGRPNSQTIIDWIGSVIKSACILRPLSFLNEAA